jgi:hypothetical protein
VAICSGGPARWTGRRCKRAAAGDAHRGQRSGEEKLGKQWEWMRGSVWPGRAPFYSSGQ